jgi:coatomer subunit beta'
LAHLDKPLTYLGFVPKNDKIYLMDREKSIYGYTLHISYINYQNAILNGDLESAEKIFSKIPEEIYNQAAKFLDSQGYYELALSITKDEEHQFELYLQTEKLDKAYEVLKNFDSLEKWRQLGNYN